MPGGEIHLLGVLRGAQKFDVQQSPEVLVEFFTRAYHPPSLMSTLQNAAWAADVPRFSRIPRGAAAPLWKAAAAQRIHQKFARALTAAQTTPNDYPCTKIIPRDPVTIQEPGIVLEFFWRRWNFIFSGSFSVPYKYETRFVKLSMWDTTV